MQFFHSFAFMLERLGRDAKRDQGFAILNSNFLSD